MRTHLCAANWPEFRGTHNPTGIILLHTCTFRQVQESRVAKDAISTKLDETVKIIEKTMSDLELTKESSKQQVHFTTNRVRVRAYSIYNYVAGSITK